MTKDVLPPPVRQALEQGNKIEAIKRLREVTGLGLKEAKDWIDSYERGEQVSFLPQPSAPAGSGNMKASFTLSKEAVEALKSGNKIEAIKIVREATGLGLAEAKTIVDMVQGGASAASTIRNVFKGGDASGRRPGLAPGQVADSGGAGKWLALIAIAAIVILVAIFH